MRYFLLFLINLNFALGALASGQESSTPKKQFIYCGKFVDVVEKKLKRSVLITVKEGKIAKVRELGFGHLPQGRRYINLAGKTCLPGLIDTHVHLESSFFRGKNFFSHSSEAQNTIAASTHARKSLLAGFTTVRDVASVRNVALHLRQAIDKGEAVGPRILAAGPAVSAPQGHGDPRGRIPEGEGRPEARAKTAAFYNWKFVTNPAEVTEWFSYYFGGRPKWALKFPGHRGDALTFHQPDTIKVMGTGGVLSLNPDSHRPQLSQEVLNQVVAQARSYGDRFNKYIPVAVHAHGIEGILIAVRAGVDSVEHATELFADVVEPRNEEERQRQNRLRALTHQAIRQRASSGNPVYLAPTLMAAKAVLELLPKLPDVIKEKAKRIAPIMLNNARKMVESGFPIVFGTDTGLSRHGDNWQEFELLTENGMSAMEALRSATIVAAEMLGREDLGSIEPGKAADIIAVKGNPLKKISRMGQVSFVMKGGQVYKSRGKRQ